MANLERISQALEDTYPSPSSETLPKTSLNVEGIRTLIEVDTQGLKTPLKPNSEAGANCTQNSLEKGKIDYDEPKWVAAWEGVLIQDRVNQNPDIFKSITEKTKKGTAAINTGDLSKMGDYIDLNDERIAPHAEKIRSARWGTEKKDPCIAILKIFQDDQNALYHSTLRQDSTFCQRWDALHRREEIVIKANSDIRQVPLDFAQQRLELKETDPIIKEHSLALEESQGRLTAFKGDAKELKEGREEILLDFKTAVREKVYSPTFQNSQSQGGNRSVNFKGQGFNGKDDSELVSNTQLQNRYIGALAGKNIDWCIVDGRNPSWVGNKSPFFDAFHKHYADCPSLDPFSKHGVKIVNPFTNKEEMLWFYGKDLPHLKYLDNKYQMVLACNKDYPEKEKAIDLGIKGEERLIRRLTRTLDGDYGVYGLSAEDQENAITDIKNQAVQDLLKEQRIVEGKSIVPPQVQRVLNAALNGGGSMSLQGALGPLHSLLPRPKTKSEPVKSVEKTDKPKSDEDVELDGSDLDQLPSDEIDVADSESVESLEESGSEEPQPTETASGSEKPHTAQASSKGPTPEEVEQ